MKSWIDVYLSIYHQCSINKGTNKKGGEIMLLRVIAQYKNGKPSDLTLTKERKTVKYGNTFEVTDEARANVILNTLFQGKPVAEVVEDVAMQDDNTQDANNKDNASNVTLDNLTVNELKELAAQEAIELTTVKKADIIVEIETARVSKEGNNN